MKAIIFGGTGWVGHNIARVFSEAGHEAVICSRGYKTTYENNIPRHIRRVRADKSRESEIAGVLKDRYDVVVDSVPGRDSVFHIAEHARGCAKYIHCGSTGGYAPLPYVPGDESCPYGHFMGGWKEKAEADAAALSLFREKGFPAAILRPSYITGPGDFPIDNMGGRRRDFIKDILAEKPLVLANDGRALLQPVHVVELARAFLLAALEPGGEGEIYNVCLEKAVTVRKYFELTAAALGRKARFRFMPLEEMVAVHGRETDEVGMRFFAEHMCYDIRKARERLKFFPRVSTEEAIKQSALWSRDVLSLNAR